MIRIEFSGVTPAEIVKAVGDFVDMCRGDGEAALESLSTVSTTPAAAEAPRSRGRGRPPGARNKPKEESKIEEAPVVPTGPVASPAVLLEPPAPEVVAAPAPAPEFVPVASAPSPVDTIKTKMRDWIIGSAVAPDVLTTWIMGYGAADVASIDPSKHAAMIADLDAKIAAQKSRGPLD